MRRATPQPDCRPYEPAAGRFTSVGEGDRVVVGVGVAVGRLGLNPAEIVKNLKDAAGEFIKNPVKAIFGFVKAVVTSIAHINELKDAWDAYQDEDWERLGRITGKLVVDVGGQLAGMLLGGSTVVNTIRQAAKDFAAAPNLSDGRSGGGDTVPVYRVEGPGNERVIIGSKGEVDIKGDKALFLNFGDRARAEEFLAMRLGQGYEGTTIKSFRVYSWYYDDLVSRSVPERLAKGKSVFEADRSKTDHSYGLRATEFPSLKCGIVPGSGC